MAKESKITRHNLSHADCIICKDAKERKLPLYEHKPMRKKIALIQRQKGDTT